MWSVVTPEPTISGYRTGPTVVNDQVFWLGGSGVTYNYDGIAYDGGAGVEPVERSLRYNTITGVLSVESIPGLPMDHSWGCFSLPENCPVCGRRYRAGATV